MGDEHLDTILAMKSDKFIKSSVENLVLNPSESKGEHECDVPVCDDFTTFSNLLFDVDDDFSSSDDESFSDEDISKKIYSNPLFDEEIISMKIDPHHFNAESDLIESLLNHDSSNISFSSKIDFFLMSSPVNSLFSNQFHRELMKLIVILRKKLVLSRNCSGTDLSQAVGTGLSQTVGTDLSQAAGTDLSQAAATDLSQATGTDLSQAAGTDLSQAAGTDLIKIPSHYYLSLELTMSNLMFFDQPRPPDK
nr:hypothetical protein [Tanacetum cinerariifolium]